MSEKPAGMHSEDPFNLFLSSHFKTRKKTNPKYSIRAFALFLEIDQSLLTKVLNGERTLSRKMRGPCLKKLGAGEELIGRFTRPKVKREYNRIEDSTLNLISDWKHLAVLEILTLKDFDPTETNIGAKLGFTRQETSELLRALKDHGFITEEKGKFRVLGQYISWTNNLVTSETRRLLQQKIVEKSLESLKTISFEHRDHSSVTLALNKRLMPKYKEILSRFRKQLIELLQANDEFDEVYQLSIALFPLTKIDIASSKEKK